MLRTDQAASNNMGAVHGGTAIAAAATVAETAIAEADRPALRVRSLRIHYPRPTVHDVPAEVDAFVRYHGRTLALVDVTTRQNGTERTLTRVIAEH
ncbi:acyl-CoA thioesterase domain-containing protein [Leifsonia poae]|uniref:acyl-CoA thioesterase domain-containing protein n=1 Tax=Leifsonia poae TaxID=110933 RepID=UPI003D665780